MTTNRIRWGAHGLLVLLSFLTLAPVAVMAVTAVKPTSQLLQAIPTTLTLDHFAYVLKSIPFASMLGNTVAMAVLQTLLQASTALLAAWAFCYWPWFPARSTLFVLLTLTWLVPFQATLVPNYVLISRLGWLNSLAGLVLPHAASTFAFLWIHQSLKAFPRDLIGMARIDGIGPWNILWRLVVPNLQAPLISLGIFSFISAWNEYFWPLLVTRRMDSTVLQIGLQMFQSAETGDAWGAIMACAVLVSLPVLVLYAVLQKQIIDSFLQSGLR